MANGRAFPNDDDPARTARAMTDRTSTENRVVTDEERLEMYRMQTFQAALPDLPKVPGWHMIWLSTQNQYDPINRRMNLGYEPLRPSDCPQWDHNHFMIKTGEWAGFIGWNEMIAFKIPQDLYARYMKHSHYDAPNQEESRLKMTALQMREEAERHKGRVQIGEGLEEIGKDRPAAPSFVDDDGVRGG